MGCLRKFKRARYSGTGEAGFREYYKPASSVGREMRNDERMLHCGNEAKLPWASRSISSDAVVRLPILKSGRLDAARGLSSDRWSSYGGTIANETKAACRYSVPFEKCRKLIEAWAHVLPQKQRAADRSAALLCRPGRVSPPARCSQ